MYLTYSTTLMPFNIHLIISSYLRLNLFDTGLLIQHLHAPLAHYIPHPFQSPYSLQYINHEAYHHAVFPSTHTPPWPPDREAGNDILKPTCSNTRNYVLYMNDHEHTESAYIYIYIYIYILQSFFEEK